MITFYMMIAFLAIVGFIIGMINPAKVKCDARWKVALIFLGIMFLSFITAGKMIGDEEKIIALSGAPQEPNQQEVYNQASQGQHESQETQGQGAGEVVAETNLKNATGEAKVGTTVRIGNFMYQVNDVMFRKSVGDEWFGEVADGIYLLVDLSIKNVDKRPHMLDNALFSLEDLNGNKYEYSTDAATALELSGYKTVFLKECQPEIVTRGVLVFEVPKKGTYYLYLVGSFWGTKSVRVKLVK